MSNRAELAFLARNLRRYLQNQQSMGVTSLQPASAEVREAYDSRREARRAIEMERARAQLMGPALGKESAPEPARAPARPSPARQSPAPAAPSRPEPSAPPAASKPSAPSGEGSQLDRMADALGAKRTSAPAPAATSDAGSGALWKQLGARPTRLFANSSTPPAEKPAAEQGRNRVPDKPKPANSAATPMLFPDLEAPKGGARVRPLPGFDATPDEARKLAELDAAGKLDFLRSCLGDCSRCKLHTKRSNIVFGDGSATARLVFVGEGPGYNEDRQGIPFVGKAGTLLNKMISAMGLDRTEVYILNVVKCRPPNNRDPERDEIDACSPYLFKQLETIDPEVIITLGRFASQTLLDTKDSMGRMRGKWRDWRGVKVMPTFHPAYLLRSPEQKRKAWNDLQLVMAELGLS